MEKAKFKTPGGDTITLEIWEGYDGWYAAPEGDSEMTIAKGRDRRALGHELTTRGYERISE